MATLFTTARTLMAPYVDNGVAVTDTDRIDARIDEAQRRLVDHYNFVIRREEAEPLDNSGNPKPALVWASGGTTGDPTTGYLIVDNLDATKNMILALWREENNALEMAQALEQKAYTFIERDVMSEVERQRKATFQSLASLGGQNSFGGLTGRIGLETVARYAMPESRIKSFVNQAYQQAVDHYNFVSRREDKERVPLTFTAFTANGQTFDALLPGEVVRLLTLSLIVGDSGGDGTGLKQQAFELIERNVVALVEQARREAAGEEGRLHNELPDGVKIPTDRMTTYLAQAASDAAAHWSFLARREDYSSGTVPSPFPFEVRKKLVESYIATANAAPEVATSLKQEAFTVIERDLMTQVEATRRAAPGDEGRLHNELPEGVRFATSRLTTHLAQAAADAGVHWDFLARREDHSSGIKPNPFPFEVRKKLVESYVATQVGQADVAAAMKQEAFAIIERDLVEDVESIRRATRQALLNTPPDSFGYHWGRVGLELPEGYKLSDVAVKRIINSAEEQLMFSGKWVGTVGEYTLTVNASGEVYLPQEIETVLFMSFDKSPRPVHDRMNEWLRGGTGNRDADTAWREGAVDRGEEIDPDDGKLKRKYWITLPNGTPPVIRVLAKRRFLPHTLDADKMFLRNYQAIYEAAKGIALGGDQITPHIEKAKEFLAAQIAQQSFVGNRGSAHTRPIIAMR